MIHVIIIIHLLIAVGLVGSCSCSSEGGALGIGGGGGGGLTGRTANLLTRVTAVLAVMFIVTSLALAGLAGGDRVTRSIIDEPSPPAADLPAPPACRPRRSRGERTTPPNLTSRAFCWPAAGGQPRSFRQAT